MNKLNNILFIKLFIRILKILKINKFKTQKIKIKHFIYF